MKETTFTIEVIKKDLIHVEQSMIDDAFIVEGDDELHMVALIRLRGKYDRDYKVITRYITLTDERVVIDGDIMIVCLYLRLVIVDLAKNEIINTVEFDCSEIFGLYKFKSGYFMHGEERNYFLDKNINVVWEAGCVDIFVNPLAENELEIFDNYITVLDWYGYKHIYNEHGEYKIEYFKEFDMGLTDKFTPKE